ncbi:pilus assembly protein PilM [Chloroflexota bacterium]
MSKVVTLYLDDSSIRLLVTQGRRIRKWAELPLEPGMVEGAVVMKEAEVAARIKQLLESQRVRARKVVVGLSGLHCLTRPVILPQLPKAMLAEAITREAKRLLPLPLEQLYLTWQPIPASRGKTGVFLVAVRRASADALIKTMRQIGLSPYIMDVKPLALGRLAKEATAIVVDIQPTEFDILIMVGGVPQPIRTVSFPREALSWSEKFPQVIGEVDRTIKFYNANNEADPITTGVPIFVSGELSHEPKLRVSLSNELGHPVSVLPSPLKLPSELDVSRYLVNISLALKEGSLGKMAGPSVARANLLPTAYQPKPISWARVIGLPSAIAIIGLLIPLVMFMQSNSATIASMRGQLNSTSYLLAQKHMEKKELKDSIAGLGEQIAEVETYRDSFSQALDGLRQGGDALNSDLKVVVGVKPDATMLSSIRHSGAVLTIMGFSPDEVEVLLYARQLEASQRFGRVTVSNITRRIEEEGVDFTLVLETGEE